MFRPVVFVYDGVKSLAGKSIIVTVKDKAKELEKENKSNHTTFPSNPYDFNPKGLKRETYIGKDNGMHFKWFDPINGEEIFRWDEDFEHGPHYHIKAITDAWPGKRKGAPHYKAGELVPEPYASWYF